MRNAWTVWLGIVTACLGGIQGCGSREVRPQLDPSTAEITIEATGRGAISDDALSMAQGWAAAERAARVDGYRRLAEQLYGILVRSNTEVRDGVLDRDQIETQVDAYVRNARVIDTRRDTELEVVEVDLVLHLGPDYQEVILRGGSSGP